MVEVDAAFIQALEHRPKPAVVEAEGIPLIDLSAINSSDSAAVAALAAEIGRACETWGFFQVINHGVPLACREKMESASRKFFAQSLDEKLKVRRDEKNPVGYHDGEHTKNVRDWKEVYDFVRKVPTIIPASPEPDDREVVLLHNQWPDYPPNFREVWEEYFLEIEKLAYKLLELISLSLGLPGNRLKNFFDDQTSFPRLNYYPRCPAPENQPFQSLKRRESMLDSRFIYGDGPNRPATGFVFGPLYLAEKVYQLSPVEDVALATVLVRQQRLYDLENKSEELVFTAEKYGSVRRVFIVSENDEVAKKEFQEWMIDRNSPAEVEEIERSDHMVMVSKPVKLSALLLAIAAKTYR